MEKLFLVRHGQSLSILLDVVGNPDIPVIKDKALNERCYGSVEGLNKADTALKYGAEKLHIWRS